MELLPGCFTVVKAESETKELRHALGFPLAVFGMLMLDRTLTPAEALLDLRCAAAGTVDFKDLAAEEAVGL